MDDLAEILANCCWADFDPSVRRTGAYRTHWTIPGMCGMPATTDIGLCDAHYEEMFVAGPQEPVGSAPAIAVEPLASSDRAASRAATFT